MMEHSIRIYNASAFNAKCDWNYRMLFKTDIESHRTFNAKYIQRDLKKKENGSFNTFNVIVHHEYELVTVILELPEENFFFRYIRIYEWRVSFIYVYVYINISMWECVQIVKREAVIFKCLKYTVPSLTRSKDSLISIVPICWKHLSFQERKVSTKFKTLNSLLISLE